MSTLVGVGRQRGACVPFAVGGRGFLLDVYVGVGVDCQRGGV